jgi:hypothetical protein
MIAGNLGTSIGRYIYTFFMTIFSALISLYGDGTIGWPVFEWREKWHVIGYCARERARSHRKEEKRVKQLEELYDSGKLRRS